MGRIRSIALAAVALASSVLVACDRVETPGGTLPQDDTDNDTNFGGDSDTDADSDPDIGTDEDTEPDTSTGTESELLSWIDIGDWVGCTICEPELIPMIFYTESTEGCGDLPLSLGETLVEGDTGVWEFTSGDENYEEFVGCLTNGVDDQLTVYHLFPSVGGAGWDDAESGWGIGSPDLWGHEVTVIRLEVYEVIFEPYGAAGQSASVVGRWEFWGD
jgi:hypothetical protein